jgi:competence protein ComGC
MFSTMITVIFIAFLISLFIPNTAKHIAMLAEAHYRALLSYIDTFKRISSYWE